jgi:SulP family sulfate permease
VAIGGWSFDDLRDQGWVFDVGKNTQAWWKFYTLFVCPFLGMAHRVLG